MADKINQEVKNHIKQKYKNNFKKSREEIKKIDLLDRFIKLDKKYFAGSLFDQLKELKWSARLISNAGNCSHDNVIKLSVDYHRKYPEHIDKTLVHEMCHIRHHNHSQEFYDEMARINRLAGKELAERYSKEKAVINYVSYCPECMEVSGTYSKKFTSHIHRPCGSKLVWIPITK